jgi:hypothetical protein
VIDEIESMRAALLRSRPADGAPAHIAQVLARDNAGAVGVRFATYDALRLDITVEADDVAQGVVVGVQIRDAFDRALTSSRTDWQGHQPQTLAAGERLTQSFTIPRLALGTGRYLVTAGIVGKGPSGERLWQWVDGAWTIQVFAPADALFGGPIDLDLQALPAEQHARTGVPS